MCVSFVRSGVEGVATAKASTTGSFPAWLRIAQGGAAERKVTRRHMETPRDSHVTTTTMEKHIRGEVRHVSAMKGCKGVGRRVGYQEAGRTKRWWAVLFVCLSHQKVKEKKSEKKGQSSADGHRRPNDGHFLMKSHFLLFVSRSFTIRHHVFFVGR